MKVKTAWANITPNAKKYVANVLGRGWLSYSLYMPRFEREVAAIHGAKHGIMVNSGTDALRISLATLKELHKWKTNSGVIVPAVTFVATVNAIIQSGLKPVFVDVDLSTCNVEPKAIARAIGPNTVAIMCVHLFGLPADMCAVTQIAKEHRLKVIEDSCEAFGVHRIKGNMAAFSFYISHHISTGVGGMILTNSDRYMKASRSYMNHGRIDDGSHFRFGRIGYSSRATEMEAALGIAGLEHYESDLIQRRFLARRYWVLLGPVKGLCKPFYWEGHSWMFYPILLKGSGSDALLKHLRKAGVESREAMPLINQPVFKALYEPGSCPNAELWTKNGLLLPLHPQMSEQDVAYVCRTVGAFFNK